MAFHTNRTWGISDVATAAELAEMLTQHSWTLCSGFRLGHLLFLNDATSEDGAQEYCVVREADGATVESITMSWCTEERARRLIEDVLADEDPTVYGTTDLGKIEDRKEHGRCWACA